MLLLLVSLPVSRAALSSSLILFLALTVISRSPGQQWKAFVADGYAPVFTLLFFVPFVSGLWSHDAGAWLQVVRLKLPLLFLPFAFAGNWQLTAAQWRTVCLVFLGVVAAGCGYSLVAYALNPQAVHLRYLQAKTLQTPLENDHVRFSWLVSVAVIGCFFFRRFFCAKNIRIGLLGLAGFFIIYLHLLAARTGLGALYLFLLFATGRLFWQKKKRKAALLAVAAVVLLPLLAYSLLPTLQNRIRYLVYDFSFVKKAQYQPGTSDGARVLSLQAGWHTLQQHPLGVGAGDVMHEVEKWYAAQVPQMLPADKLHPSSEWLIYGAFAGWPGVVVFTLVLLFPAFRAPKHGRFYQLALGATAAFSFMFDTGLEVQYGIFLYAFLTFWWRRMAAAEAGKTFLELPVPAA